MVPTRWHHNECTTRPFEKRIAVQSLCRHPHPPYPTTVIVVSIIWFIRSVDPMHIVVIFRMITPTTTTITTTTIAVRHMEMGDP